MSSPELPEVAESGETAFMRISQRNHFGDVLAPDFLDQFSCRPHTDTPARKEAGHRMETRRSKLRRRSRSRCNTRLSPRKRASVPMATWIFGVAPHLITPVILLGQVPKVFRAPQHCFSWRSTFSLSILQLRTYTMCRVMVAFVVAVARSFSGTLVDTLATRRTYHGHMSSTRQKEFL